jgi:hypothetical protein
MEVQRAHVKAFQAMYWCCQNGNPHLSYEHSAITKSQVLMVILSPNWLSGKTQLFLAIAHQMSTSSSCLSYGFAHAFALACNFMVWT